jgi:hypothetical protein
VAKLVQIMETVTTPGQVVNMVGANKISAIMIMIQLLTLMVLVDRMFVQLHPQTKLKKNALSVI